jgi:hypothetical protein
MQVDKQFEEFQEKVEPIIKEAVQDVLEGIQDDIKEYGKDIAKEYAISLWASKTKGGAAQMVAETNMQHLLTQVDQLAMIHHIRINDALKDTLTKVLSIAFKVGTKLI